MFLGTYRGNVYPKRRFWVHVGMAGADGFGPPVAESESAALPLGEAPYQKALHWSAVHDVSEAQKGSIEWQELMESNHRARIWNPLFSH